MRSEDKAATQRVLDAVLRHRADQHRMGYGIHLDDQRVNGELISAAICYANLAEQQINTRSFSGSPELPRAQFGLKAVGGTDYGYTVTPAQAKPPREWPLGANSWYPAYPRYNLLRAATLIVAELERIDRMDRELFREKQPAPKRKAYRAPKHDTGLLADLTIQNGLSSTGALSVGNSSAQFQRLGTF